MSFIAKNPLTIPEVESSPSVPKSGTRGLFAGKDGWYDVDSNEHTRRIATEDDTKTKEETQNKIPGGVKPITEAYADNMDMVNNTTYPSMKYLAESLEQFRNEISDIGKAIENGGEIFNDYENNIASGLHSHAEGFSTRATGLGTHAEGCETVAEAKAAHAEGTGCRIIDGALHAHVEGYYTIAEGIAVHAEGFKTTATGAYSHAEGREVHAEGEGSHAEGYGTKAIAFNSHAEGCDTQAQGVSSHAEGNGGVASGLYSHVEGLSTKASGQSAHAEGDNTQATGDKSHTEGYHSKAQGMYGHAEGSYTEAKGNSSHAEGNGCIAIGTSSHAEGKGSRARSDVQHVQGKYNIDDYNGVYAHIVGNGTDTNNRSNAHTLDWEGNAWYAGDVVAAGDVIAGDLSLKSLHYYGDVNIVPSDAKLFEFTVDDTNLTATIKAVNGEISGDVVIPYEYMVNGKIYKVTTIGSSIFNFSPITSIIIPNSVTNISDSAFANCLFVNSVTIPNSVTNIGNSAFFGCTTISDVYYMGTEQQWNNIILGSNNEDLTMYPSFHYEWTSVTTKDIPAKVSQLENDAEYVTASILSDTNHGLYDFIMRDVNDLWHNKADKVKISTSENASYTFDFSDMYNSEMRLASPSAVSIVFKDDEYSPDYISGLSFNCGETLTAFDYTDSGIINWVGTDTSTFTYQVNPEGDTATISLFIPSPNTHYDIVFYYNGNQFIGLVNGFVPATGNVVSE